jgi:luciferase family oxidoreductase group 1
MDTPLRLGLLSFASIYAGEAANHALWGEVEAVGQAEALGYGRYWLAEHRRADGAVGRGAVLLAVLAGVTSRIRIGSAGVLLRYENPYTVAEDYRLLATLYPRRVDLGVCSGKVFSPAVTAALLPNGERHDDAAYADNVRRLVAHARGRDAVAPPPVAARPPSIWVLGGGGPSIELAAENGCALSLSLFHAHARRGAVDTLDRYTQAFRPSLEQPEPEWNVAVAGHCAESDADAARVRAQHDVSPVASIQPNFVGTPAQCRAALDAVAERYRTREIIFYDIAQARAERARSMARLAEVCGLAASPAAEVAA